MNKEWSESAKTMLLQISKKETFEEGIKTLITLRNQLFDVLLELKNTLPVEDFYKNPCAKSKGYDNATIIFSLWHTFRIEDIVTNTIIKNQQEVLFSGDYQKKINAPVITTANEIPEAEMETFSKPFDVDQLYQYIKVVKKNTDDILNSLSFEDMKRKFTEEDKERVRNLKVVSDEGEACWLVDFWCNKTVKGLIGMPLSRHWIMHVEACLRIKEKLLKKKK